MEFMIYWLFTGFGKTAANQSSSGISENATNILYRYKKNSKKKQQTINWNESGTHTFHITSSKTKLHVYDDINWQEPFNNEKG